MKLRVSGLTSGYGEVPVVQDVSLEIASGEVVSVVGANGAGKSTLVKTLVGLLPLSHGAISLNDHRIENMQAHKRTMSGLVVVLEGRHLFDELTVDDTLRLAKAYGAKRLKATGAVSQFDTADVYQLFPALKEKASAAVGVLSGGQQQMVAIAKSLLLQPDVLILDEMSTGLAPRLLEEILEVLLELKGGGMSMLLIEQSVGVAAEVSDRAYVMELGKIIKQGDWATLADDDDVVRAYLGM